MHHTDDVIQGVRKKQTVGAAVVAGVLVLSGCGTGDGDGTTTTTPSSPAPTTDTASAGQSGNPWDLPLEQRPALFDPCTEIPVDAIEEGLGGPVERTNEYTRNQPGELNVCGWETNEAGVVVLSTWKSRDEYLQDHTFTVVDPDIDLGGRPGMRMLDATDSTERSCLQLFFTERGTVWLMIDLIDLMREFQGERSSDACSVLEQVAPPIVAHLPEGDFQ